MIVLNGIFTLAGITWQIFDTKKWNNTEGLTIKFSFGKKLREKDAISIMLKKLENQDVRFLFRQGDKWYLSFEEIENYFDNASDIIEYDWMKGTYQIGLDIFNEKEAKEDVTVAEFEINKEIVMNANDKIFLSHKSIDKELVRRFKKTLDELNLKPWLDEDAMVAGDKLERSILKGFQESCAAVFFITSSFKDAGYLEAEIDYALSEKRKKKDNFSIITLVINEEQDTSIEVPEILRSYVWKEPKDELEALREIIKSIPLYPSFDWKSS